MKWLDSSNCQIQPSISGNSSFQTSFGGATFILSAVLTLLCSIAFGRELWEKSNPSVNMSDIFLSVQPTIQKSNMNVIFAPMFNGGFTIPNVEKYIRLSIIFADTSNLRPSSNVTIFTSSDLLKCNDAGLLDNNTESFLIGDKNNYYCINSSDPNVPNIQGVYGSPQFIFWSIFVNYCQNSTKNSNSCKPREEIQSFLSAFFFHIIISDYYVNSNDYTSPLQKTFFGKITKVSATSSRRDIYSYKQIEYLTDVGLMLESLVREDGFFMANAQSEFFYNPSTDEILKVIITNLNLKSTYNRSYTKIQKVTADIGGFIKFCTIILSFLNSKYSVIKFYGYFCNYLNKLKTNESVPQLQQTVNNLKLDYTKEAVSQEPKASFKSNNFFKMRLDNLALSSDKNLSISLANVLRYYLCCPAFKNEEVKRINRVRLHLSKLYSIENLHEIIENFYFTSKPDRVGLQYQNK